MKPVLVLYHDNCKDGFCAAWVVRKALTDIEAVSVSYGQPAPDVTGRQVVIVDFSYKRHILEQMYRDSTSILVLDHHKSAKEELEGLGSWCHFEDDKSGARMAWEHFFPKQESPWLVDYTEDRDLWRHKLPNSREINAALRSYPLEFEVWDDLERQDPLLEYAQEGSAILRVEEQMVQEHILRAKEIRMAGHYILAVNATVLFSEIAGRLAEGRPFGACYFDRADGKRQWSLRSRDGGVDVSKIAAILGGGGHHNAAGFEISAGLEVLFEVAR